MRVPYDRLMRRELILSLAKSASTGGTYLPLTFQGVPNVASTARSARCIISVVQSLQNPTIFPFMERDISPARSIKYLFERDNN